MASSAERCDDRRRRSFGGWSWHRTILVAAALAFLAANSANAAGVTPTETVTCGETITHSLVVSNNLSCGFMNPVLTVGADNITIDLGGHTIFGNWVPPLSSKGHSSVTIENGTLENNATALPLSGDHHDIVRNVNAEGGSEGPGISLIGGSDNTVVGSKIEGSIQGASLELENESDDVIDGNQVLGPVGDLAIGGTGSANQITGNTVGGIDVTGAGNTIGSNVVKPQSMNSVFKPGIAIEGNDNTVGTNDVVGSAATGGTISQFPQGIKITGTGNDLVGNTSDDNAGDGIDDLTTGNTITANTANGNGGVGIDAVSGVTDGGRNHATGNAESPQCVDIDCSSLASPIVSSPPPAQGAPAVPTSPSVAGIVKGASTKLVIRLDNVRQWVRSAVIGRFYGGRAATKLTAFRVSHCSKQRSGRFRCSVSWQRPPYSFAGTVTVGSLNATTGHFRSAFALVRRNLRTGIKLRVDRAY